MNDERLERALAYDFSAGTEAFRDDLLRRCLEVLRTEGSVELDDEQLELLSAAGDPFQRPTQED